MVKALSLGRLRRLLEATGAVDGGDILAPAAARAIGRRVERAAMRLPVHTKCLPRAITAQWLMSRQGLHARLVIAVHRHDRSGEHAFHAWVEHGDEIVVGHCDRADYAPVMILAAS